MQCRAIVTSFLSLSVAAAQSVSPALKRASGGRQWRVSRCVCATGAGETVFSGRRDQRAHRPAAAGTNTHISIILTGWETHSDVCACVFRVCWCPCWIRLRACVLTSCSRRVCMKIFCVPARGGRVCPKPSSPPRCWSSRPSTSLIRSGQLRLRSSLH